jgi:hypothetical protein
VRLLAQNCLPHCDRSLRQEVDELLTDDCHPLVPRLGSCLLEGVTSNRLWGWWRAILNCSSIVGLFVCTYLESGERLLAQYRISYCDIFLRQAAHELL